jgi:hypothetical protein
MKIKAAKITELIFFRKQQSHKSFSILHILLSVEVSLFVLSPDLEDRDAVEVATWRKFSFDKIFQIQNSLSSQNFI